MPGEWQRIGGDAGGTVAGLAAAPSDAGPVLFAATSVGVFRSTDEGCTWTLAAAGPPLAEGLAVSSDFARDRTLFVSTADGLYRSSDAGQSWHPVLVESRISSVATAAGGVVIAGTEADGAMRSEDGGRSWTSANAGLLDLAILCVAQHGSLGFAGTPTALHRTRNGARSWRAVDTGGDQVAVQCLAISPNVADDGLVFAGTEGEGLLRSQDGGSTWQSAPGLDSGGVTAVACCASSPVRPTVAAATPAGIAVSHDGGQTWRTAPSPGTVLALAIVALRHGEGLLAGLHQQGVALSVDGGATWRSANAGLSARLISGAAFSRTFSRNGTVFVADVEAGLRVSTDAGRTWLPCGAGGTEPLAVGAVALSPEFESDRTLFAATPAGLQISRSGGESWNEVAPTSAFDGAEVTSIALSPAFSLDGTLFVATRRPAPDRSAEAVLWRSTSRGERWDRWLVATGEHAMHVAVSPTYPVDELVFAGLGSRVLQPMRRTREVRSGNVLPLWSDSAIPAAPITTLAASPRYDEDRTLFVGTSAGVYVSSDGGRRFVSWSEGLTPPGIVALSAEARLVYAIGFGGTLWSRERPPRR